MARPTTITNEQIIEAAREVFLERGLEASTAAIAKAAGVSEGTLFNRFGNKTTLFEAAMGVPAAEENLQFDELIGKGDVRENLAQIALRKIAFFRELLPRFHLVCTHPEFDPRQFIRQHPDPPPLRAIKRLTNYIDAEMKLGRLAPGDAEVVARVMMGSLHSFAFMELVGVNARLPMPERTFVRGLVHLLLEGIAPDTV